MAIADADDAADAFELKIDLIRALWKEREEQQAGSVRPDAIHACISADCD